MTYLPDVVILLLSLHRYMQNSVTFHFISVLLLLKAEVKKNCSEEKALFFQEISAFNDEYGLLNNRELLIANEVKSEIQKLELEMETLNNEMKIMENKNVKLNVLQKQKEEAKEELLLLQSKLQAFESKRSEAVSRTKLLEEEKEQIIQKPQTDAEFLRLKKELEAYKEDDIESVCESLRTEINFLQMVCILYEMGLK
ncbi:coiled-coil domain-containing protein 172 [Protopterus annectens]|uniref:coiled-coil domain-containing protein 172 n=1 Tax=Protopterus annectens TaxID=7888 RepID=UPI001CFA036A|nr:coiled-coil domain-containing protein 172 [Protopterus annectens]